MTPEQFHKHAEEVSSRNIEVLGEISNTAVKNINNIIFVISAGTFAVSISFIGYLKTPPHDPALLIIAWIFFICAICGNVAVHYIVTMVSEIRIREINEYRVSGFNPKWDMLESKNPKAKSLKILGKRITYFIFLFIFLGLVFLVCFGGVNLFS